MSILVAYCKTPGRATAMAPGVVVGGGSVVVVGGQVLAGPVTTIRLAQGRALVS